MTSARDCERSPSSKVPLGFRTQGADVFWKTEPARWLLASAYAAGVWELDTANCDIKCRAEVVARRDPFTAVRSS
jgi:hypothetical protein